ncbi:PfkB family carbohydrate kinase [Cellulomonas sp. KRMCY2]|uniref:PfkB family carbohydrate kinase n=1 Tax=Cellulomonas sp. KRMCY2 TaxID=1304865 RepID=UPI00045E8A08|nr:PfkB family carbohydrate kinase [Cellulomonas sp. KRMCY2]
MPDVVPARHPGLLLACGLTTLDVVQTVEHVPSADEKVVATGLSVGAGGPAANAAVTCVALGTPARLVTRIGGGALGRAVAADLLEHGVEVADRAGASAVPAVSTVLVTRATGQRAVVSVNATLGAGAGAGAGAGVGAGAGAGAGLSGAELERLLDDVGVVLVDGHNLDLAVAVASAARDRGVPVVLDGGSWKPGLEQLLRVVNMAVLSADFRVPGGGVPGGAVADGAPGGAAADGGVRALDPVGALDRADALATLLAVADAGPSFVARSQGGGPIQALRAGSIETIAVPAVRVADTLGAGDVLHGALCAWVAVHGVGAVDGGAGGGGRGLPDPAPWWPTALAFAAEVASASCAAPGARGWLADRARVGALRSLLTGV